MCCYPVTVYAGGGYGGGYNQNNGGGYGGGYNNSGYGGAGDGYQGGYSNGMLNIYFPQ